MLLSLVAATLLSAPRAPAGATLITHVPSLAGAAALAPFLQAAGTRSVLLRPDTLQNDLHPLLPVDLTRPESWARLGLDAKGSLTRSELRGATVTCTTLADVKAFAAACDEQLARRGTRFTTTVGGVLVVATKDPLDRVQAGYAVQGAVACAISGHGRSVEKEFPALVKALSVPPTGPGLGLAARLPGAVTVVQPDGATPGAVTLSATPLALTLDARTRGAALASLAGPGPSPYGGLAPPAVLVARARMAKAQLPALLAQVARALPAAAALEPAARALAPHLTGNVALVLSHVKVGGGGLRTREARLFALKLALLAETDAPDAARAALASVEPPRLAFREGTLELGLAGKTVYLATDPEVRGRAVAAVAPGVQAHGLEWVVEPKAAARALAQVPLLEAVQAPELAGLLAASAELGPLLLASEKVTGWLDSAGGGQHQAQLTWRLDAAKVAPDGGP